VRGEDTGSGDEKGYQKSVEGSGPDRDECRTRIRRIYLPGTCSRWKVGGTACRTKESSVERRNPANGSRISSEELCTQVILAVNGGNQTAKQI
jgi:hypothetical protein